MLEKISNLFINSGSKFGNSLIKNYDNFNLSNNTIFHKEDIFKFSSFKSELLDLKNLNDISFKVYWRICKVSDQLLFESLNFKCNLFVIFPKFIGREYNKTTSFSIDYNGCEKSGLFEVLYGEGFFILEDLNDVKNIKIISVKKGSYVYIPKGYVFTIINSSSNNNFVCLSLLGKNTRFKTNVLSNYSGSSVFYTKNGFIRNQNITPGYKLVDYNLDYLEDLSFNKELGLYQEFLNIPEKFNFLK